MNSQFYTYLLETSKRTSVSIKKILDMFYLLKTSKTTENNVLIRKVGVSRNALNQVKQSLAEYLEFPSTETQLNNKGISAVKNLFPNDYANEESFFDFLANTQYRSEVFYLKSIQNKRPSTERKFDQFTATIETTARRAALLNFFGDIKDKNILFIGDDDFTSLSTARCDLAKEVTVIDIDERILSAINAEAKKQNLNIKTILHDVRKKLPQNLIKKYDVVFTDPPYTPEGVSVFLSRAVQALDPQNQCARIYLCYGNSDRAKERFLPIYNSIFHSGLMLRWIFDKFNRYQGAESIGSASSLLVCEVTPKTKAVITEKYEQPIYTID